MWEQQPGSRNLFVFALLSFAILAYKAFNRDEGFTART